MQADLDTPVDTVPLATQLAGRDRRSIGRADAVAKSVIRNPERFTELWAGLDHPDPVVRMRAADALEKVTTHLPGLLAGRTDDLLRRLAAPAAAEVRWHLVQMTPRLTLADAARSEAIGLLECHLADASRIVAVSAMQALFDLVAGEPARAHRLRRQIENLAATGSPAVKSRGRKLLAKLPETPK